MTERLLPQNIVGRSLCQSAGREATADQLTFAVRAKVSLHYSVTFPQHLPWYDPHH